MRALSIRIPIDLYMGISDIANDRDLNMNHIINELLRVGLHEQRNFHAALLQLALDLAGKSE
jgi:predicted DNA-binding ribbon-helix-helix protein